MTDYEWEIGRFPKAPDSRWLRESRSRKDPIAEYVALEFPRESIHWVVKSGVDHEAKQRSKGPLKVKERADRRST